MLTRLAPVLFVLIWSSGFVVARAVTPHAASEIVLLARMTLTAATLGTVALILRQKLPTVQRLAMHLLAGALLNGVYLCTSWWAIGQGMPTGVMALLGALQPLVVAIAAFLIFGERLSIRGCTGLAVGLVGVVLVLLPLLVHSAAFTVPAVVVLAAVASIVAMAAGTMVQKSSIAYVPVGLSSRRGDHACGCASAGKHPVDCKSRVWLCSCRDGYADDWVRDDRTVGFLGSLGYYSDRHSTRPDVAGGR